MRAIYRLQGFCKSWEIRRAYNEVRATTILFQRHARSYLAHQKLLDWREVDDPELTPAKKREVHRVAPSLDSNLPKTVADPPSRIVPRTNNILSSAMYELA